MKYIALSSFVPLILVSLFALVYSIIKGNNAIAFLYMVVSAVEVWLMQINFNQENEDY